MKWFMFAWVLSTPFLVWADNAPKPLSTQELVELSAYIGEQIEAESVDCSNILPFIQDYFKLSTANQLYLTVSANRLALSVDQLISQSEGLDKNTSENQEAVGSKSSPYACVEEDSFASASDAEETQDLKKDIKQDIACAVSLISENEWTLSDQAEVIKEILPTCLSSKQ